MLDPNNTDGVLQGFGHAATLSRQAWSEFQFLLISDALLVSFLIHSEPLNDFFDHDLLLGTACCGVKTSVSFELDTF